MEYKLDIPKLSAPPEVRIGDRMVQINNRKSVVDAIDAQIRKDPGHEIEAVLECALGKEVASEILIADHPLPVLQELVLIVRAALSGSTLEEARNSFRKING